MNLEFLKLLLSAIFKNKLLQVGSLIRTLYYSSKTSQNYLLNLKAIVFVIRVVKT